MKAGHSTMQNQNQTRQSCRLQYFGNTVNTKVHLQVPKAGELWSETLKIIPALCCKSFCEWTFINSAIDNSRRLHATLFSTKNQIHKSAVEKNTKSYEQDYIKLHLSVNKYLDAVLVSTHESTCQKFDQPVATLFLESDKRVT